MYPADWRRERLDALATPISGGTPSKQRDDYWDGNVPWVTAKDLKSLFITNTGLRVTELGAAASTRIVPPDSVLVLVRGMTLLKDVPIAVAAVPVAFNQDIKAYVPGGRVTGEFLAAALTHQKRELRSYVDIAGHGTGRLPSELLGAVQIAFPSLREQKHITSILKAANRETELLQDLIRAKYQYLAAVREVLLTRPAKSSLRTSTTCRLGDITVESTLRNDDVHLTPDDVMGVHKNTGIIPMRDRTVGAHLERYKVLRPNAFAYNPMRVNIGSIARWNGDKEVLVSPDYVVFAVDEERADPRFVEHFCRSSAWRRHVESAGNGGVRIRIYYDDIAELSLRLPSLVEQQTIIQSLETFERELTLLRRLLLLSQRRTRGLMHHLMPGVSMIKTIVSREESL